MSTIPNIMPINWLVPGVAHQFDPSRAIRGLIGMPRSILLIGQGLAAGNAAPNTVVEPTSEPEAIDLFGEGSMLLAMYRAMSRNVSRAMPIYAVMLEDDAGGNAAAGTITVSAAPTGNGTLRLYINGTRLSIAVVGTQTAAQVATNIAAAIEADNSLPVNAVVDGGTAEQVNLTCKWKGETGNDIDLRINYFSGEYLPKDMGITFGAMSGGTGNPDITDALAAIDGVRHTQWVVPYTDSANMLNLEAELDARWAGDQGMLDAQVSTAVRGTTGQLGTWAENRNSQNVFTMNATKTPSSPWEQAARVAARVESQCAIDPAVPFIGKELVGNMPAIDIDLLNPSQRNLLLEDGISTWLEENGRMFIERMVTNYTETPLGAPDKSYRNVNWVKTLSYWRWFVVNEFTKRIQEGFKLAEYIVEPIPGQKIMTAAFGTEEMLRMYQLFIDAGLMQNMDHYQDTLLVQVDGANGRLKIIDEPLLVTQLYQAEVTSAFVAGSLNN